MSNYAALRLGFLVLLFLAGAWEDILPGLDGARPGSFSDPVPPSDADDDAGDGFVLNDAPAEAILLCEFPLRSVGDCLSFAAESAEQNLHQALLIRPILHVPISRAQA